MRLRPTVMLAAILATALAAAGAPPATAAAAPEQGRVVVADAVTHEPVAHASLYAKENGRFRSCISDARGVAHVAFAFQRLTVSHLNYEPRRVHRLSDTIFLQPRYQKTPEVVVTNREPEWIRRCLKEVVRQKERHYYTHEGCQRLTYDTQSLGKDHLYRFHMTGLLRMRDASHQRYALVADSAAITASDSTRLTDTNQLRRMLTEDFMADLDNAFIRAHRFYHNADHQGRTPDEVELRFRSKKDADDRGWMVVDTTRCIVVAAYRFTGTKANRQERIDRVMYLMARGFGYRIDTWTRDYRVSYAQRPDGTLYPAQVRYKMYYAGRDGGEDRRQRDFHEQTGGGFPNMEATLTLSPCDDEPADYEGQWRELPPSWYIAFNSDADRQREVELSNLPATFTIYNDEP